MKKLSLLGATGSIGVNVLNIVRQFPDRYDVVSLAAGKNIDLLRLDVPGLFFDCKAIST